MPCLHACNVEVQREHAPGHSTNTSFPLAKTEESTARGIWRFELTARVDLDSICPVVTASRCMYAGEGAVIKSLACMRSTSLSKTKN